MLAAVLLPETNASLTRPGREFCTKPLKTQYEAFKYQSKAKLRPAVSASLQKAE